MKGRVKFVSIRTKIYCVLFLMISVGAFICSFGTFGVLYNDILEKNKMDYRRMADNVMASVNSNIENIIRCSELILTNREFNRYLQSIYNRKQDYFYFLSHSDIEQELQTIVAMNSSLVENIMVVDREGVCISYNNELPEEGQNRLLNTQQFKGFFHQDDHVYYSCSFIGERSDLEIGKLYIEIKDENLFSSLMVPDQESLRILVTDKGGDFVAGNDDVGEGWELISEDIVPETEWRISARINKNILTSSIWKAVRTIVMLLICVIGASYFLCRPVVCSITEPLVALAKEMKNFKKGNHAAIEELKTSKDEIRMIAAEYQNMVCRIQKLIDRLQKQKETEIQLYMAQVNPHFIYNTLYALICVAEKKEETELAEKIKGVANILCLSLYNKPESFHTIRQEIESINQYLDILKYKYGEGIQVLWKLDPGIENESVAVLLLYPLVENAVFHGLSQVKEKHLTITFHHNLSEEYIIVEDNGCGMSQEEIYGIYSRFELWMDKIEEADFDVELENSHVGLFNLRLRLYFIYGEAADLIIESAKGKGTRVMIKINTGLI